MCELVVHEASECPEEKKFHERRRVIQALAAGGVVTAGATTLGGCTTLVDPEGNEVSSMVSPSALNNMAAQSWASAKKQLPTSNDPLYKNRLERVGKRVSRGAEKDNEAWDYAVFDKETKNAFVLPGNRVGFYKGMMDFVDNDSQLAAIMGHEVGHVTANHAAIRAHRQQLGQLATVGVAIAGASATRSKCNDVAAQDRNACLRKASSQMRQINGVLGMGLTLGIYLPYQRKAELQSDRLGAYYMNEAGYDPYQSVRLWEKMAQEAKGKPRPPEFMSTHPNPETRIAALHNYIKAQERRGSQGWTLNLGELA